MLFPRDVPRLTDGDVTLRAHHVDDIPAVVEQCTDPLSVQWTVVPLDYTPAMAKEYVTSVAREAWESGQELMFAVETTHPDGVRRFSGTVSLRNRGDGLYEIAYGLHPAARGRGVMSTAVRLMLDWGFAEAGMETCLWYANVGNVASRRVAWRAGFTLGEVVLPKRLWHRDHYRDAWVGALHKDDARMPRTRWIDPVRIVGDGFVLREQRADDVPRVVEAYDDPVTARMLTFLPTPYLPAEAQASADRWAMKAMTGVGASWVVADAETDEFLGHVCLPHTDGHNAEVGYATHPRARGRGLTTAATLLLVRHCFIPVTDGGLGLVRLYMTVRAQNAASLAVARATGFTEYGREHGSVPLRDGGYDDLVLLERLR